jgi:hypothetical protein
VVSLCRTSAREWLPRLPDAVLLPRSSSSGCLQPSWLTIWLTFFRPMSIITEAMINVKSEGSWGSFSPTRALKSPT